MLSYMLYMITSYGNVSFRFINFSWNHRVVELSKQGNSCTSLAFGQALNGEVEGEFKREGECEGRAGRGKSPSRPRAPEFPVPGADYLSNQLLPIPFPFIPCQERMLTQEGWWGRGRMPSNPRNA